MTTRSRELFITGLRNAHSMEVNAREMMERQSQRLDDYPEVKAKVSAHLTETEGQLKRLDECLRTFGEDSSTMKDTAQSMMANMAAMAHSVADDEILKNTFADNAFENYEIAAYKSLLAMCGPAGAENCKPLLEANLREEQRMADWLAENVGKVTMAYVQNAERAAA
jgi:ferritin-like metal-binding protein YciE